MGIQEGRNVDSATGPLANTPEEHSRASESGAEAAAAKALEQAKSNARLTKLFTAVTLLVGICVVGVVGLYLYQQPPIPHMPVRPQSRFGARAKPSSGFQALLAS